MIVKGWLLAGRTAAACQSTGARTLPTILVQAFWALRQTIWRCERLHSPLDIPFEVQSLHAGSMACHMHPLEVASRLQELAMFLCADWPAGWLEHNLAGLQCLTGCVAQLVAKRPVSPHVFEIDGKGMHYKFPINATTSIMNRVTGTMLTLGARLCPPGLRPAPACHAALSLA